MFMKSVMSEEEAARTFVHDTIVGASTTWPAISEGWRPWVKGNVDPIDSPWTMHEFILANASARMRDLASWALDKEQAERIRNYVMTFLSTPDLKISSLEAFEEYDLAWSSALAEAVPPFQRLAETMFARIGARLPEGAMEESYRSVEFLLVVGQAGANFGGHYWRAAMQKSALVQ